MLQKYSSPYSAIALIASLKAKSIFFIIQRKYRAPAGLYKCPISMISASIAFVIIFEQPQQQHKVNTHFSALFFDNVLYGAPFLTENIIN